MANSPVASEAIGIGNFTDLIIDERERLFLSKQHDDGSVTHIQLVKGPITKNQINFIIECLQRISIHAKD